MEANIPKELLDILEEFCKAFYTGVNVKISAVMDIENLKVTSRINEYSGQKQFLASEILTKLKEVIKKDA